MAVRKPVVLINGEKQLLPDTDSVPNADKLDGKDSTEFASASHNHDSQYLGISAKAADSDKLDGKDSSYYATAADLTSHTTNTNNPHNVTAAQLGAANILTQIKTVDGAGSGLDADLLDGINSTDFSRVVERASAAVGPGWVTVAESPAPPSRRYGEFLITSQDPGTHVALRVSWIRAYNKSYINIINYGHYLPKITGVRVLWNGALEGMQKLQIYVIENRNYATNMLSLINDSRFILPVLKNPPITEGTIEGYTVLTEITNLDKVSFATSQGLITPLILSSEIANTSTNNTVAIDWRTGNLQSLTLTQNTTVTFTSPSAPCNLQLRVIQDATGGRTITLPTLKKANGTTISFTTTANAVDLLQLYFDGTNYIVTDFIKDIV